jgi:phosphoribosylformylglycinamidine synthase
VSLSADAAVLADLESSGRVVLRYAPGHNPNGAANDIAGICSASGNVVGMMPHPERATSELLGSADGRRLFTSLVAAGLEAAHA